MQCIDDTLENISRVFNECRAAAAVQECDAVNRSRCVFGEILQNRERSRVRRRRWLQCERQFGCQVVDERKERVQIG